MLHLAILSCLLLVSCCDGSSLLYVRPDNYTLCPDHGEYCLTLSEYAQGLPHYFGPNTTLVFLPGDHFLDTDFNVNGSVSSALAFTAYKRGRATQITCINNVTFRFEYVDLLMFADLSICCGGKGDEVGITADSVTSLIVHSCIIHDSLATALLAYKSSMVSTGSKFLNNRVSDAGLPWLSFIDANASLTNCAFANNSGNGVYILRSSVTTSGTNTFVNNLGVSYAVFLASNSNISLSGSAKFSNNTGGIYTIVGSGMHLLLEGETDFESNNGLYGGAITALSSVVKFTGNTTFTNNSASYGGALYAALSSLYFLKNCTTVFANNSVANGYGGAVFLKSNCELNFLCADTLDPGIVRFQGNFASRGGALYIQDSNPLSYCLATDVYDILVLHKCFFKVLYCVPCQSVCPTVMYFESNEANEAGRALYGGAIDTCVPDNFNFSQVALISPDPMEISSDPYIVCTCNDTGPDCDQPVITRHVHPGGSLSVQVIALGQRHGPTPATILATLHTQEKIDELKSPHEINNTCTSLSYTVFGAQGNRTLVLYAEGPCLTLGTHLTIEIEVLKCPPGFKLNQGNGTCECNDRLQQYTVTCNIEDRTIWRGSGLWVGYDQVYEDVILYPNCPFDYCVTRPVSFVLEDYNAQCRYNRAGLLCGGCGGLSLLLGSSRCGKCSNSHLGLLVFFAVAGVLLVVFLLTFNLTVAVGTINGLIFYANIVASNQAIFFPKESKFYHFLKVFVAWINLNFGIESCFYNGMDAYSRAWLQYVFPTYIWSLIVLVFVVSHFSQRASRILGSNPVAVLATLILLSYTKILRTIIEALHYASLEYPYGHTKQVWIYDGNIPFLGKQHLVLFVFSVLVLTFLFIPYTLLLFTSQWLQIKSHWKIFSWLNKPQLRAFLDAYHAPYKPRHRYWTGLLLLTRFAILLVSALNTNSNPALNLLVVFIFVLVVLAWQWVCGGVYRIWCLDILDSFFFLNILFLVLTSYYVKYESTSFQFLVNAGKQSQEAGTVTLVTASLVVFVGIFVYHGYLRVRRTAVCKCNNLQHEPQIQAAEEDSGLLPVQAPTRSYVAIPKL